ncbi:hypothetical protein C2S52_020196 [Perilla frutescens var. hirtella]|nr:hypothetical protein C2S52_020196 [Perilla frutescens var. hirtella]KAH6805611.1 hypothetical protein C2S51_030442 [Perilla frutescens var. frutescens]
MCGGSKSDLCTFDLDMEDRSGILQKGCSKLLELAATDDLAAFIHEVEERGVDVNEARFWYGRSFGSKKMGFEERTPIMIASLYGSTQVLKYIVETCRVDVNKACGSDGATALHCAAAGGAWSSVEVVEVLIRGSGDINAVDANGKKAGDLIAPCIKSSSCSSKRKTLEMMLNGVAVEVEVEEEDGRKTPQAGSDKYPMDVGLPDINNGVYGSDEFRMYNFKVKPCSRAYSHDWTECPFVHPGENARRRDPRKYNYTCVPCPEFKKGSCGKGDACEYAHGVFESWLHPAQYRTRLCKDEIGCARKVCFFAHKPEELRPLYASTGSAMPSPTAAAAASALTPLSTPPMSPSSSSSPMWQTKLSGSRLKTSMAARDVDLDMADLLRLDFKPTNLDEFFGSLDPSMLSHLQGGMSPNTATSQLQIRNHLRASYPSNTASASPARKPSAAYGFDSSAAVAAAVMNSRSSAFSKRSQSFIDRGGVGSFRSGHSSPSFMQSKLSDWNSPDGKLEWGFNGDDASKLRKSASFGFHSGNAAMSQSLEEPDVSWVSSLVKDVPPHGGSQPQHGGLHEMMMMPHWIDQMYIEQEQMVA